jgi:anti-sigma factor RsiW
MSNHVTEWLNAYHDGELKNGRLQQVEKHLAGCESCRMELESLRGLSGLLQEAHTPDLPSPERFAAQVNLLLPQRRTPTPKPSLFEAGWWMIPVGILTIWVFASTALLLSNVISVADSFGLLGSTTSSWISNPAQNADVTATLGGFGLLRGDSLQWAERTESVTRNAVPQIVLQGSVAVVYLAWFAVWWVRHTRQMLGVRVEG